MKGVVQKKSPGQFEKIMCTGINKGKQRHVHTRKKEERKTNNKAKNDIQGYIVYIVYSIYKRMPSSALLIDKNFCKTVETFVFSKRKARE